MKAKQFMIAITGVPHYYAVFKMVQVPIRLYRYVEPGDLLYWSEFRQQMVRIENSRCLQVEAEYLDFVAYMTTAEMQEATHVTNA